MRGEHTPDEITQRRQKRGMEGGLRGWPKSIGIGGRLQSYWVADFNRNQWPTSIILGGRVGAESAHLALPNEDDVRIGVKAAKIAAYIGDMNKYPERGGERDKMMSKARRDLDWEKQFSLSLYPEDAMAIRASRTPEDETTCTMCGDFCASRGAGKLFSDYLTGDKK